jgi:hypothetical protein
MHHEESEGVAVVLYLVRSLELDLHRRDVRWRAKLVKGLINM